MNKSSFGAGVFYAILAYFLWGLLPLYWKLLSDIDPFHIVGLRIIFSLVLVGGILLAAKNYTWLNYFRDKRQGLSLLLAGLLVSTNWVIYIWAVNNGYTIETALGYYINPLISVVLGLIIFKEKINLLQKLAFASAVLGVLFKLLFTGALPWISLVLAVSFSIYGVFKKTVKLSALESLGGETLAAIPVSLFLLTGLFGQDKFPNLQELNYLSELPVITLLLLLFCGLVTMLPLFLFAKSVKILPLSTIGFLQFLAPTLTFLTGIFIFQEEFPNHNFIVFGLIWASVILYIISLKRDAVVKPEESVINKEGDVV